MSVRIKNAEAAEADAGDRAAIGENEQHAAQPEHPDASAISAGQGALPGDVGPVEILQGALLATKASGQPDWPTRVSAARALAALRPEELELKKEDKQPTEPSIVVYDLPPGAAPVLHRAREGADAPVRNADAPSAQHPTSSSYHTFSYEPPDGCGCYRHVVCARSQPVRTWRHVCRTHDPRERGG